MQTNALGPSTDNPFGLAVRSRARSRVGIIKGSVRAGATERLVPSTGVKPDVRVNDVAATGLKGALEAGCG